MGHIGYVYIWEYVVRSGQGEEFERLYGPTGRWVELFYESTGYVRTELHRDRGDSTRYLTVDYWVSEDAWLDWRAHAGPEYEVLDALGAAMTVSEREVGRFTMV